MAELTFSLANTQAKAKLACEIMILLATGLSFAATEMKASHSLPPTLFYIRSTDGSLLLAKGEFSETPSLYFPVKIPTFKALNT